MRRFGTPKDVANAVLFAALDKGGYITGRFIETAGGKYCVQDPMNAWNASRKVDMTVSRLAITRI